MPAGSPAQVGGSLNDNVKKMGHIIRILVFACLLSLTVDTVAARSSSTQAPTRFHPLLSRVLSSGASDFRGARMFGAEGETMEEIGVVIYTVNIPALRAAGIRVQSVVENFVSARIGVSDLAALTNIPGVQWVEPASVCVPATDVSVPMSGAPLLHDGFFNNTEYRGKGAIVLVQDFGIDFRHLDFRDPNDTTKSRILAIWDQSLTKQGMERSPDGFTYGVEYTKEQIEAEFRSPAPGFVREKDLSGHGTHVTGIAAGNGLSAQGKFTGMAPEADIVFVKIPGSLIDGLQYAENIATKYGKPVSVNWSLGTNGPCDGSSPEEVAVDNFSKKTGRVVSIAAGNDGNKYLHKSGTIPAKGADTISFTIPEYTPYEGTMNDIMDLSVYSFTPDAAELTATVVSPHGVVVSHSVMTPHDSSDGVIRLLSYKIAGRYSKIDLFLFDANGKNPAPGLWRLVMGNTSAVPVDYHAFPMPATFGGKRITVVGGDNEYTVWPPATSRSALSVGAYLSKWGWPSAVGPVMPSAPEEPIGDVTSYTGRGPTTDGRQKPDLCAPGSNIFAAYAADAPGGKKTWNLTPEKKHQFNSGTSMASPHVAGTCALLLAAVPSLTADALKALLQSSATTDHFTVARSKYFWGSGKLDAARAMALLLSPSSTFSRSLLSYDSAGASGTVVFTSDMQAAIRISPSASGTLTQAIIRTAPSTTVGMSGSGDIVCRLYTNIGGLPGVPVGAEVRKPLSTLYPGTYNYLSLVGAGMQVVQSKEYFLVVSPSMQTDTLTVEGDGAALNDRSLTYAGGEWKKAGMNLRLRAELSSLQGTTTVAADDAIPSAFELKRNYPNPFNPTTLISYVLPARSRVKLAIYDVLGKNVTTLIDGEQSAGTHRVEWNGRTSRGYSAASGVYLYRIETESTTQARTMLLVK